MARVFDIASETSAIFEQYKEIHDEVFGFSIGELVALATFKERAGHADRVRRLEALMARIRAVQRSVRDLQEAELTKRSRDAIRSTLLDYTGALEISITRLQAICRKLHGESEGLVDCAGYSQSGLRSDKIDYDYSIQECRRHGARLTALFAEM